MQDDSLFPSDIVGDTPWVRHGSNVYATTPIASIAVTPLQERRHMTTAVCERIYLGVVDPNSLNKTGAAACHNTLTATRNIQIDMSWEDARVIMNAYLKKYMAIHQLSILPVLDRRNRLVQVHLKNHRLFKDIRGLIENALHTHLMEKYWEIQTNIKAEKKRVKQAVADAELAIIRELREARKREAQQQKEAELLEQERLAKEQEEQCLKARLQSIVADIAEDEWD